MGIDKTNYEAYFLDFLEGNLRANQVEELNAFLSANPHLKEELEGFEFVNIEDFESTDHEVLKSKLRREETTQIPELDYLLISSLENKISKEEKKRLEELKAKDPGIQMDEDYYLKTRLQAQELPFNFKSRLKRKTRLVYLVQYSSAAAAAILFFMFFPFNFSDQKYKPRQANLKLEQVIDEEKLQMAETVVILSDEAKTKEVVPKTSPIEELEDPIQYADESKPKVHKPIKNPVLSNPQLIENDQGYAEITPIEETPVSPKKQIPEISDENPALAQNEVQKTKSSKSKTTKEEYPSLEEFAKNKIKKDILKNKTFGETLAEEIAELSKEKINFKQSKDEEGNTELIAFNIGKFKFSRKK